MNTVIEMNTWSEEAVQKEIAFAKANKKEFKTLSFTGAQYLMIDCANAFGLDKKTFAPRIQWVKDNLNDLENFIMDADEPVLYAKTVLAIRAVQRAEVTGHLIELDATTSGVQILSALTGCYKGALWTNLIDPDVRMDCYTNVFNAMLVKLDGIECDLTRKQAKICTMTAFYGSTAEPESILGIDTPELEAFYNVISTELPGAYQFLEDAKGLWNPYALEHSWTLPDGHVARVKVMQKTKNDIEDDDLDHHTFTFQYKVNKGSKLGVSLAANLTHSIDAYVIREINARCNYNATNLERALRYINKSLSFRTDIPEVLNTDNVISINTIDRADRRNIVYNMSTNDLIRLKALVLDTLTRPSFEIVAIHDAIKCHPNFGNELRHHYKEILAELAESDLLSQLFSEISGKVEHYEQVKGGLSKVEMSAAIRLSNYSLC